MNLHDIENIESNDCDSGEYFESIQRTINAGSWSFQGSFGRAMMDAISAGCCMLGKTGATDYYGNYIPSRYEVQEGTKGSFQFVADNQDEDYANLMASL